MALHHLAVAVVIAGTIAQALRRGEPPGYKRAARNVLATLRQIQPQAPGLTIIGVGFFQRLQRLTVFRHAPGANGPEHFQKSVTRFSLQKRAALLQQFASKSRDDGGFNVSEERLIALGLFSGLAWLDTGG
ncbi:hypothetical protein X732_01895 [Mesorhizobium sp. L2C066B000]|nr:hypothetical protein X732_01895 [Mesorhizobium sp. L2C066B000]